MCYDWYFFYTEELFFQNSAKGNCQITIPESTNCSNALSDIIFPCCAKAVKASALYNPSLVTYPSCLGSTASQIWIKRKNWTYNNEKCNFFIFFFVEEAREKVELVQM